MYSYEKSTYTNYITLENKDTKLLYCYGLS